jgi:hypothetical protein
VLLWLTATLWLATRRSPTRPPQPHPAIVYAALVVAAVFTIARNLPAAWQPIDRFF